MSGRRVLAGIGVLVVPVAMVAAALVALDVRPDDASAVPWAGPEPVVVAPAVVPDISWQQVAGVRVPVSRLHGPRDTVFGAAGYSRSELGAALAAVQVLVRTSPSAGPQVYASVLAGQVTGPDLPAMKLAVGEAYQRRRASAGTTWNTAGGTRASAPPEPGTAVVQGYLISAIDLDAGTATVEVVLSEPLLAASGRSVAFRVDLVWQGGDWRVVAPPGGDWGVVSTTLGALPAGLQRYEG